MLTATDPIENHYRLSKTSRFRHQDWCIPVSHQPARFDGQSWREQLSEVRSRSGLSLRREAFIERVTVHRPPPETHRRVVELSEAGKLLKDLGEPEADGDRCAID